MTNLNADALRVPVTDVDAAEAFYTGVFGASVTNGAVRRIGLHGKGAIELVRSDVPLTSGFGRIVVTYVLDQPSEVRTLMDAAVGRGAQILKPAKKALFGSFSGSLISPEGLIWKFAADKGKDSAQPAVEPRPTEVTMILGVGEPKDSRDFYTDLGMRVDRDYGSKYIDFHPGPGAARLCLMQSAVLAKDVGIADSSVPPQVVFVHRGEGNDHAPQEGHSTVVDPDGFQWITATD